MPAKPVEWPVRVGQIPPLASAFRERAIGHPEAPIEVLTGGGGVGKSQLAAALATRAVRDGVDLLVWVDAARPEAVVSAYAQAGVRVAAPEADGRKDPRADALAFLRWLVDTERTWLIVLDDIAEPREVGDWWPPARPGIGRVVATTRRREAALSGGGRVVVPVDVYTPSESAGYLIDRLGAAGAGHLLDASAGALAEVLGHLPLALSHAAAYMINQDLACTSYLQLYGDRRTRLAQALPVDADTESYGRPVVVSLLLAVDAVQAADPPGLALPALRLVAVLDPAGHPDSLWTGAVVPAYLTAHRAEGEDAVTPAVARAALRLLHRYSLVTHDGRGGARAVRIHALTARAVRETMPAEELPATAHAAADALLESWPPPEQSVGDLGTSTRTNTEALIDNTGDQLWLPEGHEILLLTGNALAYAGLYSAAIDYWERMTADAQRVLGPAHHDTISARGNVAVARRRAGHTDEAIAILEEVAADAVRHLGPDNLYTLNAKAKLSAAYEQAGRVRESFVLARKIAYDWVRVAGPDRQETLGAWGNLVGLYRQMGRVHKAVRIGAKVVADMTRVLGPHHPTTLWAQGNLAVSLASAGRLDEAIELDERVVEGLNRALGPDSPETLQSWRNLADDYRQAGRLNEAIALGERATADLTRVLGADHPETLAARDNLAYAYAQIGRPVDAIELSEQVVADAERALGPRHPETVTYRENQAQIRRMARRRRRPRA